MNGIDFVEGDRRKLTEECKKNLRGQEEHKFVILKPCGHTESLKTYAPSEEDKNERKRWDDLVIKHSESGSIYPYLDKCENCYIPEQKENGDANLLS